MHKVAPERTNPFDKQHTAKEKALSYGFVVVGGLLTLGLVFFLALRLNYKITKLRDSFRDVMIWVVITLIIIAIVVTITIGILNLLAKKKEYKEHGAMPN